jgi:hypothetical protein
MAGKPSSFSGHFGAVLRRAEIPEALWPVIADFFGLPIPSSGRQTSPAPRWWAIAEALPHWWTYLERILPECDEVAALIKTTYRPGIPLSTVIHKSLQDVTAQNPQASKLLKKALEPILSKRVAGWEALDYVESIDFKATAPEMANLTYRPETITPEWRATHYLRTTCDSLIRAWADLEKFMNSEGVWHSPGFPVFSAGVDFAPLSLRCFSCNAVVSGPAEMTSGTYLSAHELECPLRTAAARRNDPRLDYDLVALPLAFRSWGRWAFLNETCAEIFDLLPAEKKIEILSGFGDVDAVVGLTGRGAGSSLEPKGDSAKTQDQIDLETFDEAYRNAQEGFTAPSRADVESWIMAAVQEAADARPGGEKKEKSNRTAVYRATKKRREEILEPFRVTRKR